MRIVSQPGELQEAFRSASAEAEAAFGDGSLYMERFIRRGKHIEVQVLGDGHGKVIHLFERDCSTQRRHQKLIEEAPSPFLDTETRSAMLSAAVKLAESVNYRGAGTVEFIVDADSKEFFFLEMNTRIQVEHPVTEMLTGIDLVRAQIKIAETGSLEFTQDKVKSSGHVIECRINAEDPARGFSPSPGRITTWRPPSASYARLDAQCEQNDTIVPFYDSLIGKLIVKGDDRADAIKKLLFCLEDFQIEGVTTTVAFHRMTLNHLDFKNGDVTTRWVEESGMA